MDRRWWMALLALAAVTVVSGPSAAKSRTRGTRASTAPLVPANTVIVSTAETRAFCQDFSAFLRDAGVVWRTWDADGVPGADRRKHLLVVGVPDDVHVADLIASHLEPAEVSRLHAGEATAVVETASPWSARRTLFLAVGSDLPRAMHAAERAMAGILSRAADPDAWHGDGFRDQPPSDLAAQIGEIQALPAGPELPLASLRMDVEARIPRRVGRAEALADAERLFQLLSHGYCGYGYFQARGDFDAARADVLAEISSRPTWSPEDLAAALRASLSFVHDCHVRVGEIPFCTHQDLWLDTERELVRAAGAYAFEEDGLRSVVVTVNGRPVDAFALPSLDESGAPVYRLGVLARSEPEPLRLLVATSAGRTTRTVRLRRSSYDGGRRFGLARIGGVPVVRASSFADAEREALEAFLATARALRGEPYVILDIRGNGGGNTDWPKRWVTEFTGRQPSLKQVLTELRSRTSMMGRANLFASMQRAYPAERAEWIRSEIDRHEAAAASFGQGGAAPHWTPPRFPQTTRIPNRTTLVVAVDRHVASSGEGMLSFLHRQVDNVVVVGENTMGALEFGQIGYHRLPHSQLLVVLPIKLNVPLDPDVREEVGFRPDLWVPPEHAVNYAVAAIRRGTISTRTAVPDGTFDAPFSRERTWRLPVEARTLRMLTIVGLSWAAFLVLRWRSRRVRGGASRR